jgi:hypothetical protein
MRGILGLIRKLSAPPPKSPDQKGWEGERYTSTALTGLGNEFVVMNDVLISYGSDERTTQIDHILLSRYGLFVIETKNVQGLVVGEDGYKYWTVFHGKKPYKLFSPVLQNETHIKMIRNLLGIGIEIPVFSIVAFRDDANLERVKSRTPVVHIISLLSCIRGLCRAVVLMQEDLIGIAKRIDSVRRFTQEDRIKHIAGIQFQKERLHQSAKCIFRREVDTVPAGC